MAGPKEPKEAPAEEPQEVDESETGSKFLDEKLTEIRERMQEIEPLVDEFRRLEDADRALSAPPRNRGGRPRKNS